MNSGAAGLAPLVLALLLVAPACDGPEAAPRGDSRDFALEVDEVHDRNQALHETSQRFVKRFATLEQQVTALRGELAPLSAEWAHDATTEIDAALEHARGEMAALRALTGPDWQSLVQAAESAIEDLEALYEKTRGELEERRSAG